MIQRWKGFWPFALVAFIYFLWVGDVRGEMSAASCGSALCAGESNSANSAIIAQWLGSGCDGPLSDMMSILVSPEENATYIGDDMVSIYAAVIVVSGSFLIGTLLGFLNQKF